MAFDAKTHGVIHFSLGHRLRVHIAMALDAIHPRSNVRRMIELHVRGRLESVHALPGNILASRAIRGEFLNLRLVGGNHLMAGHAEIDAWDSGVGTLIHADVAVRALHTVRQMNFVRIGDGLNRFVAGAEKLPNRVRYSAMRRGEDRRGLRGGLRGRTGILSAHATAQNRPHEDNHGENHGNAKPTVHTEYGQRQFTLVKMSLDCELAILHAVSAPVNPQFSKKI